MPEEIRKKECISCHRSSDEVPLITLDYRGSTFWSCPQHFPVLIHRPQDLIGLLPGAETFRPADIED
jgi:hypothetical protein